MLNAASAIAKNTETSATLHVWGASKYNRNSAAITTGPEGAGARVEGLSQNR